MGALQAVARPAASQSGLMELVIERVALAVQLALADDDSGLAARLDSVESAIAGPAGNDLRRLTQLFRLSERESDVLQTCLAAAADSALFDGFRDLTGRTYVTDGLVAQLFGHRRGAVWNPGGALGVWGLVRAESVGPGEPDALSVDPVVPAWLGGELWIDRQLTGLVRTMTAGIRLPSWPIEGVARTIARGIANDRVVRIVLNGDAGSGRTMFAASVAAAAGLPAFLVDTSAIGDADWPDAFIRLQRLAAVGRSALIWTGLNVQRPWPSTVAPAPIHIVCIDAGVTTPDLDGVLTHVVDMTEPTLDERRWLVSTTIPGAAGWSPADVDALADRSQIGVGDIISIAAGAPGTAAEAHAAARRLHPPSIDDVVRPLSCPFRWNDLILPKQTRAALEDLAFEARERQAVGEMPEASRLFPRELGLVALFSGPSGTGKTMAAQVIAAELGGAHGDLELLRVDVGAVLSKFIGETAKNLNRIFALARRRDAIVLFDEADSLFVRRTDVKDSHDRYANADTSHLLQIIEMHRARRGFVILATNRRSDMDPAFVRRLRHVIEFTRPQPSERLALWRQALTAIAPQRWSALSSAVDELATEVDVSGAQIKHAVLSGLFIARRQRKPLGMAHVIAGLDRELAKEGRPLGPNERERWLGRG